MGGAQSLRGFLLGLVGVAGVWGVTASAQQTPDLWRTRVAQKLLSVYDVARGTRASVSAQSTGGPSDPRQDLRGWVQVDVHYDCLDSPAESLAEAGFSTTTAVSVGAFCVVEGWIDPQAIPRLAATGSVTRIEVPQYAVRRLPKPQLQPQSPLRPFSRLGTHADASPGSTIDANGVAIMRADQFVSQTGTNGKGVTVGVQSTGIASLSLIQGRGELPAVQVVNPAGGSSAASADEGTVLLEEVHAVAPGASLAYCEPGTFVEYTSCLQQLIGIGATVLTDDMVFVGQDLMSSDSPDIQAVQQILTQNPTVALLTAAGNYNGSYWEGDYSPVSVSSRGLSALHCAVSQGVTQTDNYVAAFSGSPSQMLTVSQGFSVPVVFAWGDPSGQNASKLDLYWFSGGTQVGCLSTASSTANQLTEHISLAGGQYTIYVATPDASAAGKFLKLWFGGDGLTSISDSTSGSVVTPQAMAMGALSIGAVNGSNGVGDTIEAFSSLGPISFTFPSAGRIQAPVLVAPDGIYVDAAGTYFEGYLFPDGNFYGTSASAPNAAATAALIRGAFPNLTVPQVVAALETGAARLGSGSPNGTFGYGRIDAMGALGTVPSPTMTALPASAINAGSTSSAYPFTVSGTGKLHFTVTSSNPTLIPAAVVPAGSPGVTITPFTCGVSTLSCSLTVTAASGPSSTVKLTVAAVDGANRSAAASMTVTVSGSAAPATSSMPPSMGGGGGGGTLTWWSIASLAICVLLGYRRGGRSTDG